MTENYPSNESSPTAWLPRYSLIDTQKGAEYTTSLPIQESEPVVNAAEPTTIVRFILEKDGDTIVMKRL